MKPNNHQKILATALLGFLPLSACNFLMKEESAPMVRAQEEQQILITNPADIPPVPGVPGAAVPTSTGVIGRIRNATGSNPSAGSFRQTITQFGSNLSDSPDPLQATGAGEVPMIAAGACADQTGNLGNLQITGNSLAAARASLIAYGVRILDGCMGGLASSGPYAAAVSAELGRLADANAAVAGETVTISATSMCTAVTTFCTQMRGF